MSDSPFPPTPTAAMVTLSLGATNPRPSTCLGTMYRPEAVIRLFFRKRRRESLNTADFLPITEGPIFFYAIGLLKVRGFHAKRVSVSRIGSSSGRKEWPDIF